MIPAGPLAIQPLRRPPRTTWRVPGSKSLTNRALLLAALAEGESVLTGALASDDTRYMEQALRALGVTMQAEDAGTWRVQGGRGRLRTSPTPLFIGNSGTTVRFLTALAALIPGDTRLVGDEHMAKRPISDLLDGLKQLGVAIECPTGCPPLTVHGRGLPGGRILMRGDRSSQYFSALLMAGCGAEEPIAIDIVGGLVSRPYVEMTCQMIAAFGGKADLDDEQVRIAPQSLQATTYAIEPDASAASYALAAAAATGGCIRVPGLSSQSLQGDVAFAELLGRMGCQVVEEGGCLVADASRSDGDSDRGGGTAVATSRLVGIDADMHHISDTVMTLAALAPLAVGPTTIRNIGNIRLKETDRLTATATELRRLGQEVETGDDWLRITPRPITPATVQCYADHRMAMSFAILGLAAPGIAIADPACVAKTYPGFWDDLGKLYAAGGQERPW